MDLTEDVSIPRSISLQGFQLQDPFKDLGSHAPLRKKKTIGMIIMASWQHSLNDTIYDGCDTYVRMRDRQTHNQLVIGQNRY